MQSKILFALFFLIILVSGCSTENSEFDNPGDSDQILRSVTVEKVDIPESGFIMMFDENGRPNTYSSIDQTNLFRSFSYGNDNRLSSIDYQFPSQASYQFHYESNKLDEQDGLIDGNSVRIRFLYNDNEVQILRFMENQYHSTAFFIFSDETISTLEEVRSYDGGGQLRHQYQFEYDNNGNVIEEEHYTYDPINDVLRFNKRIQQQFDNGRNPLTNCEKLGWMEAWYLSFFEQESFIENISRFAPNNILTQTIVSYTGQSTIHSFSYEYDGYNYPISATRITNGEFGILNYSFSYYED